MHKTERALLSRTPSLLRSPSPLRWSVRSESPSRSPLRRCAITLISAIVLVMCMTDGMAAQDRNQGRSMVISRYGIVAAESPLAAQAGVQMLERGGNAVDAAIAANAMMGLVAPMSNGIGGDLFAIVLRREERQALRIECQRVGARRADHRFPEEPRACATCPRRGIQRVTVPGAVDGWQKLLDRFGKKKFAEVLAPAIQAADEGFPVTEWTAGLWQATCRLPARK